MRIRSAQVPPTHDDIDSILRGGASADGSKRHPALLRRLRQAFFLDREGRPLSARERLVEQYKKDGLVLFLGAGVSVGSGIPSWPRLAESMLHSSGVTPEEFDSVKKALPSYVVQFELARQLLGADSKFVGAIYRELYKGLECKSQLENIPRKYEDQVGWSGWSDLATALQTNETLKAVGDLLIVYDGTKPRRNPQIHAVLTVNVDTLLELYCEAQAGGKRVVRMVDRASVGDHPDQIAVYHLHGTLDARGENLFRSAPANLNASDLQGVIDDLLPELVFRESEYYETIANATSFVNHTPQSFLRRHNVLFIGTSLDDLNMRRWLFDSFRERVLHRSRYLREFYWRRYPDAEHEAELESRRHFWLRPQTETDGTTWEVPKHHVESVMRKLGVEIVWCTDYDDMRRCLEEIRSHGRDPEFGRRPAEGPS
jgi:hypothetical protein